mmetsp:Transcript_8692/g.36228  ORF Transcript_8692/g.36228 Transcript_8692/m.36228 type:complete len:649 (+) Transcript_8692:177-2123(+)
MIENVTVLHRGGVVLWKKDYRHLTGGPLNWFVQQVLVGQSTNDGNVLTTPDKEYSIKWDHANEHGLSFVVVFSKQFTLSYNVGDLLLLFKQRFVQKYENGAGIDPWGDYSDFGATFDDLYESLQQKAKVDKAIAGPTKFEETKKGQAVPTRLTKKEKKRLKALKAKERDGGGDDEKSQSSSGAATSSSEGERDTEGEIGKEREAEKESESESSPSKPVFRMKGGKRVLVKKTKKKKKAAAAPGPRSKKKPTIHSEFDDDVDLDALNAAGASSSSLEGGARVEREEIGTVDLDEEFLSSDEEIEYELDDDFNAELAAARAQAEEAKAAKAGEGKKRGFFSKWLPSLTGRTLTEEDLAGVMEEFASHLKSKNVASDVSDQLCSSIADSLVGKNLASFTSTKSVVQDAMKSALERILTPKRHIDVLKEVREVNAKGRPFSIVFVGVNGVGKSTSLAKITAWLMQNGLKVKIAACDTFRSGAVEQLKIHCDRLGVSLFEQGYGKDASHIAAAAIKQAKTEGANVVLVDTAGRMQDNEPLMKALSTLVHYNDPDLVFFVGEALVGNDGVHQLVTFNSALETLAANTHAGSMRQKSSVIDGIVLTKFDTIDDKVGAAVSMVYTTGIPVVFVGVGQHYTDLRKMNVDTIVRALLK